MIEMEMGVECDRDRDEDIHREEVEIKVEIEIEIQKRMSQEDCQDGPLLVNQSVITAQQCPHHPRSVCDQCKAAITCF